MLPPVDRSLTTAVNAGCLILRNRVAKSPNGKSSKLLCISSMDTTGTCVFCPELGKVRDTYEPYVNLIFIGTSPGSHVVGEILKGCTADLSIGPPATEVSNNVKARQ